MAKKSATKSSPAKNAAGLDTIFLEALARHLRRLDDATLAADATRYVAEGEPADVVLRLGKLADAGKALALAGVSSTLHYELQRKIQQERVELFREGRNAPAGVWVRLGEVLNAAGLASGQTANPPAGWPNWLQALIGELLVSAYQSGHGSEPLWPADRLTALYAEAGIPPAEVVRLLLDPAAIASLQGNQYWFYGRCLDMFGGWPEVLAAQLPAVREVLSRLDAAACVSALRTLSQTKFDFTPILDLVVELGTSSSKTVREAALPVLLAAKGAVPHAAKLLATGDAARRNEAAVLLWKLEGDRTTDRLRGHLASESAERVKQTIQKLLAAPEEAATDAAREVSLELPPLDVELGQVMLPGEACARIRACFDKAHQQAMAHYEREVTRWNAPNRPQWMTRPTKPTPLPTAAINELIEFVAGDRSGLFPRDQYQRPFAWNVPFTDDSFAPPGVHLIHVVRLSYALKRLELNQGYYSLWWNQTADLEAYRGRCPRPFGLRELDAAVASLPGGKPGLAAFAYLAFNTKHWEFCNWEPGAIWPAFADKLDLLRDTLAGVKRVGEYDYGLAERRRNAFRVLAAFPQLPPGFMTLLWDIALGESKTDRPLAQAALRTVPGKAEKIVVALSDGRQAVRAAAAEWLGDIGDPSAVGPLREAFKKEKLEVVKGVMMTALEKLGADVNEFLDRQALLKEAEAGLKKKLPAGMDWFPLDRLPAVRWQDTGEAVDPQVVKWWVVQAVQQKSPAAGPILRRFLQSCRPADTAALAKFVLSTWVAHDTRTSSAEEAAERARADAAGTWKTHNQYDWWRQAYKSEEAYREYLFRHYSNQVLGSAVGEKGMLAVVSAAGDVDCVRMCEQYIRKWFGQRLSQCKALVEVLAWVRHPMALQVLLGLANRFRTKAVRDLAGQFVNAIAEREGWTVDELADRTIPDAGFAKPEGGGETALVLDYGPRQFTVTLNDELEPVIRGDGAKPLKALPAPGKADDAEKAKEAKKAFSDAKKQAKDVVKRQTERLYEALCTQRAWRLDDWQRYLAEHPIVGRLCVRLAWAAFRPGGDEFLGCFRPLEDGSLTNETDDAVTFAPDTVVRLAHTANTPAALGAAWRQHFTDYDVTPPFDQFGRVAYTLPDEKKKETEILDFRGHGLTTFQLRGKATKLGYVRGEPGDGGYFTTYRKLFPSLSLAAEIEFTGSSLPETDGPAALVSLSFVRVSPTNEDANRWTQRPVELVKVPPVLLSECYNDLKQLAAEGSGFNPEWEKTSYW
jgi:hypothetical protein